MTHAVDIQPSSWNAELRLSHTVNSLRPSDAIWRHGTRSTLAQVMACCLTAPSHYLNRCWLIINKVQWHSSEGNCANIYMHTVFFILWDQFFLRYLSHQSWKLVENYLSQISFKSPRGQWVNTVTADDLKTQGADVSVAAVLAYFSPNILISQDYHFKFSIFN